MTRQGPSNKKSIRYGLSVQLLILKRQNCCREDLEEEQNGVEGKCMYTQNKGPVSSSAVEIIEMLETLFDDRPLSRLKSDS